jgi:hypothetical protein
MMHQDRNFYGGSDGGVILEDIIAIKGVFSNLQNSSGLRLDSF